jgi:hypothetical protein
MFSKFQVVNKVSMVVKDSHNRSAYGFKAVIEDEIFNLSYLSFAKEIKLEEKFPSNEMYGPSDFSDIEGKPLCVLTFNFGSVSSEKVIVSSFKDLQKITNPLK